MAGSGKRVVVLGASDRTDRYSNQAVRLLIEKGYEVLPVHPRLEYIEGVKVFHELGEIEGQIDTLSVYVSAEISSSLENQIRELSPSRVIFNPGSENPELLNNTGIPSENACTLVLLKTGQF